MRIRFVSLLLLLAAAACDKPSEALCQQALDNINKIYGLNPEKAETRPFVSKCRSQSKKKSVECMIAAKTKEEVEACEGPKDTKEVKEPKDAKDAKK
jgi:hypothetical protein